jgi:hypothetical protein
MRYSKAGLMTLLAAGVLLAGCQSARFGGYGDSSQSMQAQPPQPLTPAPSSAVVQGNLPPPGGANAQPGVAGTPGAGNQVAMAANAVDLTPGSVAGVWNVSVDGQSCKVATPQTKFGQGYRAGPLRCPGELANLSSWQVQGKQLVFYDASGQTIASLYSSGGERFDGQTTTGKPIALTR